MKDIPEKILIVDDVSKNIQILGNILAQEKFQIAYAQDGQQAIDICEVQDFDLILLDIMMPKMNGYEVCKKLKKNPDTSEIPIIFLTARADMDSIIKGFEIGGQDYITKPFNASELLARVNNHLTIKRQRERLKLMNNHLEYLVKERTMELETANHKLNVLDQAKSNFLSLISHEIRTPLNGVIGLTELLDQTNIDENQKEYLNYLKDVSSRLVKFSDIALLITALKINKYHPEIMSVSVNQLINDTITEFKLANDMSAIQIINNLPSEILLIKADSDLIKTCFEMIIDNSVKFAGENAKVEISGTIDNGITTLIFSDDGPGFSDTSLNNLFGLFSSGDLLHSEGAGLGLAAAKLILDAHEGSINIRNNKAGGAEVEIKIKSN